MTTRISKWGNGLGIRIKKSLAKEYGLTPGSEVEIIKESEGIIIRPKHKAKMTLEWLCEDMIPEHTFDEWEGMAAIGKERFWEDE